MMTEAARAFEETVLSLIPDFLELSREIKNATLELRRPLHARAWCVRGFLAVCVVSRQCVWFLGTVRDREFRESLALSNLP